MSLPFAVVAISSSGKRYVPARATVPGLGDIQAKTRDAFCQAAGTKIFANSPEIKEVRFVGPRGAETSLTRDNLGL